MPLMTQAAFPLLPIAFLTAIFYLNFVSRVILGPFLPVIEREFGLGHGGAGSLFLFIMVGYAAGLLGSGIVAWRFTQRRTIVISTLGVGLAMLGLSHSLSVWEMRAWLFLLGAAAGLYLPCGVAVITHLAPEGRWGKALAVHELAPNLGFITAPLLADLLYPAVPWRGVLALMGGTGVVLAGCFALWGEGGQWRGDPPRRESVSRVVRDPSVWVMGLLFTIGVGSGIGLYGMLPLFLMNEVGLSWTAANHVTGLSRLSALIAIFVSGWLTDRIGHRGTLMLVLTATGASTFAMGAFVNPTLTPILVCIQAATYPLFFPPAFAATSSLVSPALRNLAVSVAVAVGSILGSGGVPTGVGYLAEAMSFGLGIALFGVLGLCSPLLLRIKRPSAGSAAVSRQP
jgi:MFS transporter, NNP family, nitrate/nitrite transporter